MQLFYALVAACLLAAACTKTGKDMSVTTPPRDTAHTTPPNDTASTAPPKDTLASQPPKDTMKVPTSADTTRTVRAIDELTFYEFSDHSMGEVDIANDLYWAHVYLNDPNGNTTFAFMPADPVDVADAIQKDQTQGWVFLKYHHIYPYSLYDTAFTVDRANQYDRLVATTTDAATGKVHQDIYVTMQPWYTTVPTPVFFSVRDFKLADLPKSTGALFQQDIQALKYTLAR